MPRISFDQRTDVGMQRQENQDAVGNFEGACGQLFVVCDGMGGHAGGQIASRLAIETIGERFAALAEGMDPREALRACVEAGNAAIRQRATEEPELTGMGTTCVALLVDREGARGYAAHVGDSRLYRVVNGRIERMTRDHTAVQQLIDQGLLTEEQAALHPRAHVINRCLGVLDLIEVEVAEETLELKEGERYLLCTDGLTSMVDDVDIYRFIARFSVDKVCEELIELSNARGGYDNITVQVVQVGEATALNQLESSEVEVVKRNQPGGPARGGVGGAARRLGLPIVLLIGAVMVMLGLVIYLALTRAS